jgi:hypothetical protein
MRTLTMSYNKTHYENESDIKITRRARALRTVDWYLNGKPKLQHHTNSTLSLHDLYGGC